jgi:hypothetical protein
MYVGGNRSPGGNLRCQRESPSLPHEEWVWPGIEPTTPLDVSDAFAWRSENSVGYTQVIDQSDSSCIQYVVPLRSLCSMAGIFLIKP